MSITAIDPVTALIIVDLQRGIVASPTVDPIDEVVAHSRQLADAFRARKLPVVLVNVTGVAPGRAEQQAKMPAHLPADFAELLPELGEQPNDILITKTSWGAFATTDLDAKLKDLGVTQVVVTGVATSIGVEATARQAYEAGYNVTLALDAMTDRQADAQEYSVTKIFPRLGETGTSEDVLALLGNVA